jgi:hypothetical protein
MGNLLTYSPTTVIQAVPFTAPPTGVYSGLFTGGYGFLDPAYGSNTAPSQIVPLNANYLSLPYDDRFDLSTNDWTISAWFNANQFDSSLSLPGGNAGMMIIAKDHYGSNFDWCISIINDSQIGIWTQATTTYLIATVPTMSVGTWYAVTVSSVGGVVTINLDGTDYATGALSIANNTGGFITVGCMSWNNPGAFFNGYLDYVVVNNTGFPANALDLDFEILNPGKLSFTDNQGNILTINPAPPTQVVINNLDIVRDGLIVHYDAVKTLSYDRVGSTVNDLTTFAHTGTLVGGYSFTSDAGISFDGINGALSYILNIPEAMTHIIFAKSNQVTWSDYNGLGANRGPNGWSTHTWQSSTDISFGWNDNVGPALGILVTPTVDIQLPHLYAITTNGSTNHKAYIDDIEYNIPGTITRDSLTTDYMHIANDDAPYSSRFTDLTVYVHLVYDRQLSKEEIIQNYKAIKPYFG